MNYRSFKKDDKPLLALPRSIRRGNFASWNGGKILIVNMFNLGNMYQAGSSCRKTASGIPMNQGRPCSYVSHLVDIMRKMSFLKQLYYCYLSKPASYRKFYRTAVQFEFKSVVEIGITSLERTCRLLEIAHRFTEEPIQYCGIDLFEAGEGGQSKIGLKVAHVELKQTGAKVKLMPGDPFSSLSRSANLLSGTDLLIIGANVDAESMSRSWFYLPRMIHEESLVLIETSQGNELVVEECDYDAIMAKSEDSLSVSKTRKAA